MKTYYPFHLLFYLVMLCAACREPFEPEISGFDHNILVVEGYIEVGGGQTSIKLSRTRPIYDSIPYFPIELATVVIEGENEGSWTLYHEGGGVYTSYEHLPENQSYWLRIYTGQNQEYVSEKITPIITPDKLEITFQKRDGDVSVYANTYGNEEARYFIWDYEEAWVFRTPYLSSLKYNPETGVMETRPQEERTHRCFQFDISRHIILESSERYQNNYIYQKELVRIENLSEKLGERYSILVKQKAINQEAFVFWEGIRKNSDDIGGIFSPLPSLVGSNLYNPENPDEPVIGYVSAGKSVERRIYIDNRDVRPWRAFIPEYRYCSSDTVLKADYHLTFAIGGYVPLQEICPLACIGVMASTRACTDCTLRGVLEKPEFWEEEYPG